MSNQEQKPSFLPFTYTPHYSHQHKPMTIEDQRGRTLLKYDKLGKGLENRRAEEVEIFDKGDYERTR